MKWKRNNQVNIVITIKQIFRPLMVEQGTRNVISAKLLRLKWKNKKATE